MLSKGSRLLALSCALAVVLIGNSGCSSGASLQSVSGKVTVDNSPLTSGSVRFVPDSSRGNKAGVEPVGQIGSDGKYTLYTNGKAGAPAGWYKVTVDATEQPDSTKPFSGKSLVNKKYTRAETTDISVEVVSSAKDGDYDLKLSR